MVLPLLSHRLWTLKTGKCQSITQPLTHGECTACMCEWGLIGVLQRVTLWVGKQDVNHSFTENNATVVPECTKGHCSRRLSFHKETDDTYSWEWTVALSEIPFLHTYIQNCMQFFNFSNSVANGVLKFLLLLDSGSPTTIIIISHNKKSVRDGWAWNEITLQNRPQNKTHEWTCTTKTIKHTQKRKSTAPK